MTWNNNVIVVIIDDALPVEALSFGVPLHLTEDVTFTERTRVYDSATAAEQDSTVGATALAAVQAHFDQRLHSPTIKLGRREADVAQVGTWTITGTPAENDQFEITINGIDGNYTAGAAEDATAVAGALRTALTTAVAGEDVTVGGTGTDITVTADNAGEPFTYSSTYTPISPPGASGITEVLTTANVNAATELAEIVAKDNAFYGITMAARDDTDILYVAAWVESQTKIFMAQSSTAAVLTATAGNVLETLMANNYGRTAYCWHHDDSEYLDVAWMGFALQCPLDTKSTIWAYKQLVGVTLKDPAITPTEQQNVADDDNSAYGNLYLDFGGNGATGMGRTVDGQPIDRRTTKDWWEARLREEMIQILLDASNRNEKIRYTDKGLDVFRVGADAVNGRGVSAEHFAEVPAPTATVTPVANVPTDDRNKRKVLLSLAAYWADGAERVEIQASITSRQIVSA